MKNVIARIEDKLHKELRKKLLDDDMTYQDFTVEVIKRYVKGDIEVNQQGK